MDDPTAIQILRQLVESSKGAQLATHLATTKKFFPQNPNMIQQNEAILTAITFLEGVEDAQN